MNSTATEFLNTIFNLAALEPGDPVPLVCHPTEWTDAAGTLQSGYRQYYWPVTHLRKGLRPDRAWCYCISTVTPGLLKPLRKTTHLHECWVLVCDDVGTKAKPTGIEPSYILETSPGNCQHGYLIHPLDVTYGSGGATYVDECLRVLAEAGFNDPGCRGAGRVVRLPGALHDRTGFISRVTAWHPENVWDAPDLMRLIGVTPRRLSRRAGRPVVAGAPIVDIGAIGEGDDAVRLLLEAGMVLGHNTDWIHITCPWVASHTHGRQGATSTGYSPLGYGEHSARAFKCLHGHCSGRRVNDLLAHLQYHFIHNAKE